MKHLYVHFEKIIVGILSQDDELVYSFQYSKNWLKAECKFPLSGGIPLQTEPFGNKASLAFFENLLPEGEVKEDLKKLTQVESTFDFLAKYGADCAGAITLSRHKNSAENIDQNAKRLIDLEKIYDAIENKQSVPSVIAQKNPGYLSLAGAQDKFAAIYQDKKFYLPTKGGPTTHIIKTPIWRHGVKDSVFNEYFCLLLAKRIGFQVPRVEIFNGKYPLFIIERYDRKKSKGDYKRIHQQDLCQLQGITSSNKYENRGGPSIQDNWTALKKNIAPNFRIRDLEIFLDWFCFNLIIGNNDSHSKNFSLLSIDGSWRAAPLYDILCTAIYPKLTNTFSFKIGDRNEFSKIGRNQFNQLESEIGLKQDAILKRLKKISVEVLASKDELTRACSLDFENVTIFNRISELIEKRVKSLKRQKAL